MNGLSSSEDDYQNKHIVDGGLLLAISKKTITEGKGRIPSV